MPRAKKVEQVEEEIEEKIEEEVEEPAEETKAVAPVMDTPAKAEYRRMIEKYKVQNPIKYELKKKEFERQLKGDIQLIKGKKGKKTFTFSNLPTE